ncbi:MAG: hypothetical protein QOH31_918 [Verrucomicrobiota bacterium]|jgi:hypothetical protein
MTKLKLNITKARGIGVQAILDRRDEVLARLRARVGETTLDKV